MKRLSVWLACAVVVAGMSCSKREAPAPAAAAKRTIAVIPKGTTHEFWKSIHAGAVKAARDLNVEILWKGPLKEDDRDAQIAVMENIVSRRVDGIVLAPLDDMALRAPVTGSMRAGIPVVIIDSDLRSEDYVSFVATDNRKGGYLGGQHLAKLIGGKGRVILLRYQEGSASTMNREQGFLDAMAETPGIELASRTQYGGATTESAFQASENLLAQFKEGDRLTVNAVFCPNESTTFGMLRALQDAGLAGTVIFVGFDSSPKLVQAMRDGQIHGLVLQNPMRMGELGVRTLVDHLDGRTVDRRVDTGVAVATPQNMDTPEMRDLLAPDFARWLTD